MKNYWAYEIAIIIIEYYKRLSRFLRDFESPTTIFCWGCIIAVIGYAVLLILVYLFR